MTDEADERDRASGTSSDAETSDATETSVTGASEVHQTDEVSETDGEWEYAVDEFPTDPTATDPGEPPEDVDGGEDGGNVAGEMFGLEEEIEPGSPSAESAVFVLLGALVTVLFFLSAAGVI